jgi:arylsulfatase A-like enzyme
MAGTGAPADRLNVLLITADQLRGDFLGYAGHPTVRTPNLDALAAEGVAFPNAYSPVPVCVPARYAMMTGRTAVSLGVRGNASVPIPAQCLTLPDAFARAGYATGAFGKMHFTPWDEPYGFATFTVSEEGRQAGRDGGQGDAYQRYLRTTGWGGWERAHGIGNNDVRTSSSPLPLEHYHTTWCARETERWLRGRVAADPERPFFAWCSFTKPHSPYDPPEPYDRLYDPRAFPPPVGGAADLEGLSPFYEEARRGRMLDALGPEQVQRARAMYAGNVTLIDHAVGELRRTLRELGVAGRTVVLFTADHGDLLGDHGLFFKATFFRAAWHVPFVVFAPGRASGGRRDPRFLASEDVYPTLLDVALGGGAGADVAEAAAGADASGANGRSALAGAGAARDTVFGSVGPAPRAQHAARNERWSYVLHARGAYEELYDLRADPEERRNLAGAAEHAAVGRELRSGLERWLAACGDRQCLDDAGHLRSDPAARGWTPDPPPRHGLGLRPY